MPKVILFVQISLDGFFEGAKKELDWNMVGDEIHDHILEVLRPMGGFLSGRGAYELTGCLRADGGILADGGRRSGGHSVREGVRADLAGDAEGGLFEDARLGGVEHRDRAGGRAGRGRGAQAAEPRGPRGRGWGVGGGVHGAGSGRRVPDLRPSDPDRRGEPAFSSLEGEGSAAAYRDAGVWERGRPSAVRTGELIHSKANVECSMLNVEWGSRFASRFHSTFNIQH